MKSLMASVLAVLLVAGVHAADLRSNFRNPPDEAKLRCMWWWLNSNVTKAAITRDLAEMAHKGFGGVWLFDGNGAEQDGNSPVQAGPVFFSDAWRELFRHALREADRFGIEVSLNIQSGWNVGGPLVTPERAAKRVVFTEIVLEGPGLLERKLRQPEAKLEFYNDIAVLALPATDQPAAPVEQLELKCALHELGGSAPDGAVLLADIPAAAGEPACRRHQVLDLTSKVDAAGTLRWEAPAGRWVVLRFGYTGTGARVSTGTKGWDGLVLDYLNADDLRWYNTKILEPLIRDAGSRAGRTLKYLVSDSWECGGMNWTPAFREEFRRRRGYDLLPFLPVLAGRLVENREVSNRFLEDFRKTVGDCIAENHYQVMKEFANRYHMGIHAESGGPHGAPIDSLRCLGINDIPTSEFWAKSWRHRVADEDRFFVKQPASAAHTYGRRLTAAEGFTTIGPHWQETVWDNLKPSFDKAACEGLNRLFWTVVTCSPQEAGLPGQQFFAGTHFNPNSTWWEQSGAFLKYINRCQYLLQQGLFVADVVYYYGDHVPNFARLKKSDPAMVLPGYDYDVATEAVVLTRMQARDRRIVLPDGMQYRILVLPALASISLPALRKISELAAAGVPVAGMKPERASGLAGWPGSDDEVRRLAHAIPLVPRQGVRESLSRMGVPPDLEIRGTSESVDWIHRRAGETDIYFLSNQAGTGFAAEALCRVSGRIPEIWDPVTGVTRRLAEYREELGRTLVPVQFEPYQAFFVVFRESAPFAAPSKQVAKGHRPHGPGGEDAAWKASGSGNSSSVAVNYQKLKSVLEVAGPWEVSFEPKWSGLTKPVRFERLEDWTDRSEEGIRYYSGTAVYRNAFDWATDRASIRSHPNSRVFLDLGTVHEMAQVWLNGKDLGVAWCPPWRLEIPVGILRERGNTLEIEVVNFWPNRLIGDARIPPEMRRTRTNVRKFDSDTADPHYMTLMPSGLLGPVTLREPD